MGFFGPCDAMPDKKTMRTKCLASKRSNLAKIVIFGHFGPGLAGSFGALLVGELVGGCGARAVSCKTPIYFIIK